VRSAPRAKLLSGRRTARHLDLLPRVPQRGQVQSVGIALAAADSLKRRRFITYAAIATAATAGRKPWDASGGFGGRGSTRWLRDGTEHLTGDTVLDAALLTPPTLRLLWKTLRPATPLIVAWRDVGAFGQRIVALDQGPAPRARYAARLSQGGSSLGATPGRATRGVV
jgi:hypothetical protein